MSTITNSAVVREFEKLAVAGDLNRLGTLGDANIVNHALASGRPQGSSGAVNSSSRLGGPPTRHAGCRLGWLRRMIMSRIAYRLVGGRIVERWAIRDDLAMIVQLGSATPNSSR